MFIRKIFYVGYRYRGLLCHSMQHSQNIKIQISIGFYRSLQDSMCAGSEFKGPIHDATPLASIELYTVKKFPLKKSFFLNAK